MQGKKLKNPHKHWIPSIYADFKKVEHTGFEPVASTMRMLRAPNCANAPWVTNLQKNYSTHYGKWNKKFGKIAFSFYKKFSIIIINYGLTSGKLVRDVTRR